VLLSFLKARTTLRKKLHTSEDLCLELFQVLDSFTPQAIVELDQGTLAPVRERVGSLAAELVEEHLSGQFFNP
jgi:hypothetical protein